MTSILNISNQTQVNTYAIGDQLFSSVTDLSGGGYVVTWQRYDGYLNGVYGQVYDASGVKVGGEFQANTTTTDNQDDASVTALGGGGFVVTWDSYSQDGSFWGVYGQVYSEFGGKIGSEFPINTTTTDNQDGARVAGLGGGGFVVTWESYGQDGSGTGVYGQMYSASGIKLGGEFQVNSYTAGTQATPSVAGLDGGAFVVTWISSGQDGDGYGVYGQVYGASGAPDGGEFRVNSSTTYDQRDPSVTGLSGGGFVVTWKSYNNLDLSTSDVYAQVYGASGEALGTEFLVNTYTTNSQSNPSVTGLSDGGFVVTWESDNPGGSGSDIHAQLYDGEGHAIGTEMLINTTAGAEGNASVAALGDGGFVVTWTDYSGFDGSGPGIFQKVFSAASSLSGTQWLYGTGDADDLDGGSGNDTMYGGYGNDVYHVNAAGDVVSENANQGEDTVVSSVTYTLGNDVEDLTLTGSAAINGTGNGLYNTIYGNSGANVLSGLDGNDTIYGGAGADTIHGGTSYDTLYGGDGDDTIDSNDAAYIDGGSGNDTITGGNILGDLNMLYGGDGDDFVSGRQGDDTIDGGAGDDTLSGGIGTNHVSGGAGDDVLQGQSGLDYFDGGAGFDTYSGEFLNFAINIDLAAGMAVTGGTTVKAWLTGVENAAGGFYNDSVHGDAGANLLSGNGGDDVLEGREGNDQLVGGNGNDTASYASAASAVKVSLLLAHTWQDTGVAGLDYFDSIESLAGSKYNDTLTGDSGNNQLDGGAGADVMKGGLGDDTYVVGNSFDNVGERLNEGTDTVLSSITYALPSNVENLTLTGAGNLNATGNSDNNTIYGNSGNNLIDGGAGADKMYGGLGDDTYVVNNSFDKTNENTGEGTDTVQSSITFTIGANVENLTLTGATAINGIGNGLDNRITGNAGNNTLTGGAGNDTFVFGKFGAGNGLDHLADFVTGTDHLSFTGADYGISGHTLASTQLSLTGAATTTAAQFVYNATTHTLSWDSNGTAAGGVTAILVFDNAATPHAGDFIFT